MKKPAWVDQCNVTEERADGGKTRIAGACRVAARRLHMSDEVGNKIGIEISDRQLRGRLFTPCTCVPDRQSECVPVASDGVAACFHLRGEPIGEEALDQRGEVGRLHRVSASTTVPVI